MNAQEAHSLSIQKGRTISSILESIEAMARVGLFSASFHHKDIRDITTTKKELEELGFKVRTGQFFIVNW